MSTNHSQSAVRRLAGWAGLATGAIALAAYVSLPPAPKPPAPPAERNTPAKPGAQGAKRFPPPPLPASDYLNTGPDARYVGAGVCAECHEREARTHRNTTHSAALSRVDPTIEPADGSFFHAASGRHYRVYRQDGEFRHRESVRDESGREIAAADYPIRYLVGSGHHTRSYLIDIDGFLCESPITWYVSRQAWEISPGYDRANHRGFERAADSLCLNCHVGRMKAPERQVFKPTFLEQAIGCERCHGPGSLHVEHEREGEPTAGGSTGKTIVNPAKLDRRLSESICAQCHLMGDGQVIARGRQITDFRPGLPLSSFCINYGTDASHEEMKVVGHVSQMRASRCYQNSSTLTCITCHAGHDEAQPEKLRQNYLQVCLDCHGGDESAKADGGGCGLELTVRLQRNAANDCIACHMPQASTDVPHVAFTHHRIGIHSEHSGALAGRQTPGAARELTPLDDISDLPEIEQLRNLAVAYYAVSLRSGDQREARHYRLRAGQLLQSVLRQGLYDPEVVAALSRLYVTANAAGEVVRLARESLRSEDLSPKARVNSLFTLAVNGFETQQWSSAQKALDELAVLRRFSADSDLRGVCRSQTGDLAGALADLQQAASLNPFLPGIRRHLADVHERLGDANSAERERSVAAALLRLQSGR